MAKNILMVQIRKMILVTTKTQLIQMAMVSLTVSKTSLAPIGATLTQMAAE